MTNGGNMPEPNAERAVLKAQQFRDRGFKPYHTAKERTNGREWEIISFPIPHEDGRVTILIREKDNPMTMQEYNVDSLLVDNPTVVATLREPVDILHEGKLRSATTLVGIKTTGRQDFLCSGARLADGTEVKLDPPQAMTIWWGRSVAHITEIPG